MINTSLTPLEPEECKDKPTGKMTKALQKAYALAAENHDLAYYKDVLKQWQEEEKNIQEEMRQQEAEQERLVAERADKEAKETAEAGGDDGKDKKKKKPRKSKVADEDVEMEDAEVPKSSKKRKKDAESDAEGAKVCYRHSPSTFVLCIDHGFSAQKDAESDQAECAEDTQW